MTKEKPIVITRRRLLVTASAGSALAATGLAHIAAAQTVPRLARILVSFPPGGSADIVARLLADKLRGPYATNLIVENRPGAGGRLVLEQARGMDADGSTIVFSPGSMIVVYPHIYKKLGYDALRDFTPAASAISFPLAITAGPGLPAGVDTLKAYGEWAKANPKLASFGSPAAGSAPHFVGTQLARALGTDLNHVPYKGTAPLVQDILGGQVPIGMLPIGDAFPLARAGRARVLATTGPARSRFLPDAPTAREAGFEIEAEEVSGLFVPARTPAPIVESLNKLVRAALQAPDLLERFMQLGVEPLALSPQEFAVLVKRDFDRWGPIVKASGFNPEE